MKIFYRTAVKRKQKIEEFFAMSQVTVQYKKNAELFADCQTPYKRNCLAVAGSMPFEPHSTERRLFKNKI